MSWLIPKFYLSQLRCGVAECWVHVQVERLLRRDEIQVAEPHDHYMKEIMSIDFVVYDDKGTRMLCTLKSEETKELFSSRFIEGRIYDIMFMHVRLGGEGIHKMYHLEFTLSSVVYESSKPLPRCPLNVKPVYEISWGLLDRDGFVDVCGFIKYISSIRIMKYRRYHEKEMVMMLEACSNNSPLCKDQVKCILRGRWVKDVEKEYYAQKEKSVEVFVVVQYVISAFPSIIGCPVKRSYGDATRVLFDPPYPEVQSLKEVMIWQ